MSEVKRVEVLLHGPLRMAYMVEATHFDRVTAERDGLQISLNTADQSIDDLNAAISRRTHRVRELEGLLRRVYDADLAARHHQPYNVSKLMDEIEAALKPAEGGGDA